MNVSNEKLQKIWADMMTPSKPRTWHLIEAKIRRNMPEDVFLGVDKSLQTSILETVKEPFVEALQEVYIGYGRQMSHEIIVISKVTNRDKLNLKREVFVARTQPQVLSAYFKHIEKAKKPLEKWNVSMLDDDIIIHVAN